MLIKLSENQLQYSLLILKPQILEYSESTNILHTYLGERFLAVILEANWVNVKVVYIGVVGVMKLALIWNELFYLYGNGVGGRVREWFNWHVG